MGDGRPDSSPRSPDQALADRSPRAAGRGQNRGPDPGWIVETIVSPFHCLYQDAVDFHQQSHVRKTRSVAEASRLARAALLLYLDAAEALVHQAAVELGRPELARLVADPGHPLPPADTWRLLPAIIAGGAPGGYDPQSAPWPQLEELFALHASWTYPGPADRRRAYYHSARRDGGYEPIEGRHLSAHLPVAPDRLLFPLTGLPRDPYALRPHHVDTVRGILDAAIEALDRRLDGALTRGGRHRKEPVRVVHSGGGEAP
jgi:hypothetical protein